MSEEIVPGSEETATKEEAPAQETPNSIVNENEDPKPGDDPSIVNEEEKEEKGKEKEEELSDEERERKEMNESPAPEEYEDFTLPDGFEIDQEALAQFTPLAKELDLSQKAAQKLIDFRVEEKKAEAQQAWDNWNKTQDEWRGETRNDPEVGGQNFKENKAYAKTALDAYGNEKFSQLLDTTGLGNNVNAFKFLAAIGKDIAEDKLKTGGQGGSGLTRGQKIYDHPSNQR